MRTQEARSLTRRSLLAAGTAFAAALALGACGSRSNEVPGGYAFPKQRPSSDDYISPEEREQLRQKAAEDQRDRAADAPTPGGG